MVEFNNRTDYDFDFDDLESLVKKALPEGVKLSVAFLPPEEIQKFNERYRDKKGPTDVLSFKEGDQYLGEVLICPKIVKSQAKRHNLPYEREIKRVLIHGVLHILGYDHKNSEDKKRMRSREEELLSG